MCFGYANWRTTNVLWASEVKEQPRKHRKRMIDILFQFLFKIILDPSLVLTPYLPHFEVHFEWFKTWWVWQLGLYKSFVFLCIPVATTKDLKLEILIYFNSPNTEHWTPLHQTPHILPIPLPNWHIFETLKVLGGGIKMFFEFQNQRNNLWGVDLIWVLKCSLTDLSTLE